jgi:hypothetical protein
MNDSVSKQLSYVQKHLNAPKNRRNNFGNYNYRSCEDIVEAVKKIMPDDCIITLSDEIIMVGDRYYIKATAAFAFQGGAIFSHAFARESLDKKGMDSAQITGSASSYARKYALNGLFAIDDSKDIDEEDNREPAKPKGASVNIIAKAVSPLISKDEEFILSKMIFDAQADIDKLLSNYKVKALSELTKIQYENASRKLSEKIKMRINAIDYARV